MQHYICNLTIYSIKLLNLNDTQCFKYNMVIKPIRNCTCTQLLDKGFTSVTDSNIAAAFYPN